jgi:hypothetical protein
VLTWISPDISMFLLPHGTTVRDVAAPTHDEQKDGAFAGLPLHPWLPTHWLNSRDHA